MSKRKALGKGLDALIPAGSSRSPDGGVKVFQFEDLTDGTADVKIYKSAMKLGWIISRDEG